VSGNHHSITNLLLPSCCLQCCYMQVKQQQAEWSGLAQQLQPFLSAAGLTQQQLLWALSVTRSRAFAAPYAAAPLSLAPKAFASAQVVAAVAWLAAGPAAAVGVEVLGAAAAAGAWFTLQQQLQSQQQHAICPLLDFFNHDGREQVGATLGAGRAAAAAAAFTWVFRMIRVMVTL
jgi:hypothetical protein